jgi:hypothetical protein
VWHTNAYSAIVHCSGFEGSSSYLIGCCGMCSFGILELVTGATASTFASTIMKKQLRFGYCHTGDNHNPMLVKWLCWYFNKGHHIMTNEHNLVRMVLKALLLLL